MKRRIATNTLIVCLSTVFALLLLEGVVRLGGQRDVDGQFMFMGYALEPYALPVAQLREPVQDYIDLQDWATIIYDEQLGWTFRPNSLRQDGTFTINNAGIRSHREYDLVPPPDTLRIALFGDSFVAGDDVADDEVWGAQLERLLFDAGIRNEVLNFGVGAYGMGQAFLRWRHQGEAYDPDIVIFGLQPDNLKRNLNVFRLLMNPTGPPFSKPRFTLVNQELQLVNSPTLPPEQLFDAFENFADHPLAEYEYYYQSRYTVSNWWASSQLASLIYATFPRDETSPDTFGPDTEGGQLGKALVDAFARDVLNQGAEFIIAHLPLQAHLRWRLNGIDLPFAFLLDYSRESYRYIAFENHLEPHHVDDAYWSETKHYGARLHALLAEVVATEVLTCIDSGACVLPRFANSSAFMVAETSADS